MMDSIDGFSIHELVKEYGSPLFIVSAQTIRNNLRTFRREFSARYPKIEVAYSYKTNCLPGVLNIIHGEGAWADVASGFEYDLARRLGVSGKTVVFNGPYKRKEELKKALDEGAFINVDHIDEIRLLEEIASELGRTLDVGIRINMDVGIHQLPDRFGFNLESGEAVQVVRMCGEKQLLRITGLHVHLTSYIIEPEEVDNITPARRIKLIWPKSSKMYRIAAEKVVQFAGEIREGFGVNIKYVDMGGGFPTIDSLTPYVKDIVEPILEGFKQQDLPVLILEPGRAIVSNAVHLITSVVGMKEFPNGERGIIVDAGINLLPTSFWKWQEIEPLAGGGGDLRKTTVYGPLCLQTDILGRVSLPQLKTGDNLVIKNVGAYNISQSTSFIFPRPPVLLIESGGVRLLRRSETVNDVFLFKG